MTPMMANGANPSHHDILPCFFASSSPVRNPPTEQRSHRCTNRAQRVPLPLSSSSSLATGLVLRNAINRFCEASERINEMILELLAEHLGLATDFFSQHLNAKRSLGLRMNYYPACPQPSHVLGANVHTDGSSLTVLQQDKVGGLQIHRDGRWFGVKPIHGALVVNVGDALHAWTNGHFKSVLHRVVLNKEVHRLSLAAFLNVDNSLALSAPDELVDEAHPRLYRPFTFGDYIQQVLRARAEEKSSSKSMMDGNRILAGLRFDPGP